MQCQSARSLAGWTEIKGTAWREAIQAAALSTDEAGTVCFDSDHPAYRAAYNLPAPSKGASGASGGFIGPPMSMQMILDREAPRGLGTLTHRGIDAVTLGAGEELARRIAQVFGKATCSCLARARCLNKQVPDVDQVRGKLAWAGITVRAMACVGAKDDETAAASPSPS